MTKRLVSVDKAAGKETWVHIENNGNMVFETKQNIDNLIKKNREEQNEYRKDSLIGNTQRHQQKVAEIPTALYHKLLLELGEPRDNPNGWKKWLNDYDNRVFRTSGGSV